MCSRPLDSDRRTGPRRQATIPADQGSVFPDERYAIGEHHLTEEELAQSKFDFDLEDVLYIGLDPLEAKLSSFRTAAFLIINICFPSARPLADGMN